MPETQASIPLSKPTSPARRLAVLIPLSLVTLVLALAFTTLERAPAGARSIENATTRGSVLDPSLPDASVVLPRAGPQEVASPTF